MSLLKKKHFLKKLPPLKTLFTASLIRNIKNAAAEDSNHPKPKPFTSIPGPLSLPIVGTLYQYLPLVGRYSMDKLEVNGLKKLQLYGPIVREEIQKHIVVVWIFEPDDIEKLFQSETTNPMRRSHLALAKYRLDRPHVYNSAGLIPTNGEKWLKLRKVFQRGLLAIPDVQNFLEGSDVIVQEWIEKLEEFPKTKDYLPLISRLFLELIGYAAMDIRFGSFAHRELNPNSRTSKLLKAAFTSNSTILKTDNGPGYWQKYNTPLYKKLIQSQEVLEKMAIDVVSTKMAFYFRDANTANPLTLLEKYLSSPDLDFRDIVGVICDFLLAGMDTTAYTTSFLLYYVAKHPEIQQKLHEEAMKVLPNAADAVTVQVLNEVPYAKACLKETFRLRPISVGIGRVLTKDLVLSGYHIPTGTTVVTQNQVICRLDKYFPDAMQFIPERWLSNEKRHKYLSIPFGYGLRQCIARRLAEQNMVLLLVKLVRAYEIGWKGRDVDTKSLLINKPDGPISLTFKKRA